MSGHDGPHDRQAQAGAAVVVQPLSVEPVKRLEQPSTTGSDDAAGGCLAFTRVRRNADRTTVVTGVVIGQRSGALIPAALAAARELTDAVDPS